LAQKHGLDTKRFKALPAVPEWSDFDDRQRALECEVSDNVIGTREYS